MYFGDALGPGVAPTDFAERRSQGMSPARGASARALTAPTMRLPSSDSQCGPA